MLISLTLQGNILLVEVECSSFIFLNTPFFTSLISRNEDRMLRNTFLKKFTFILTLRRIYIKRRIIRLFTVIKLDLFMFLNLMKILHTQQ